MNFFNYQRQMADGNRNTQSLALRRNSELESHWKLQIIHLFSLDFHISPFNKITQRAPRTKKAKLQNCMLITILGKLLFAY